MLETLSRQHSRSVYLGEQTVLCRVLGKYLMYADAQETGITPHLVMDGYWESWITVALARRLRPGWHCLDIGANHGYYTLIMADAVGREGRVVPVEPTPRLADLLRQTLDVNGFPTVAVAPEAASDTDGETLQLVIPPRRSMNARLSQVAGPTDAVVDVETVTVDTLTRDWPSVDLIKIDVEGAEEQVLRGALETLRRHRPVVVLEHGNSAAEYGTRPDDIFELLSAQAGLRIFDMDGVGPLTLEDFRAVAAPPAATRWNFFARP
jgi:FkbM family methyltransferase